MMGNKDASYAENDKAKLLKSLTRGCYDSSDQYFEYCDLEDTEKIVSELVALRTEVALLEKRSDCCTKIESEVAKLRKENEEVKESHKNEVAMLRIVMTLSHLDRETFRCDD